MALRPSIPVTPSSAKFVSSESLLLFVMHVDEVIVRHANDVKRASDVLFYKSTVELTRLGNCLPDKSTTLTSPQSQLLRGSFMSSGASSAPVEPSSCFVSCGQINATLETTAVFTRLQSSLHNLFLTSRTGVVTIVKSLLRNVVPRNETNSTECAESLFRWWTRFPIPSCRDVLFDCVRLLGRRRSLLGNLSLQRLQESTKKIAGFFALDTDVDVGLHLWPIRTGKHTKRSLSTCLAFCHTT